MNSLLAIFKVLATTPGASTWEPLPKVTPLGFTRITWPFELKAPCINEGLAPVTRFRVALPAPGVTKLTAAFLPTLKLSQLTTARCDV